MRQDAVLGCYLGRRFAGDLSPYLARFDDGYCKACILQQTGGRNTDDSPADYSHIDADVARELRKVGSGSVRVPIVEILRKVRSEERRVATECVSTCLSR